MEDCLDGSDERSCTRSFTPTLVPDTETVSGKRCMFPFTYKDQQFTSCTTFDSDNGKPWCKTEEDQLFTSCITFDSENGKPWCRTEEDGLEDCVGTDTLTGSFSASSNLCRCNGVELKRRGEKTRGECKTKGPDGNSWCYVDWNGECPDASWSSDSEQFWSNQACQGQK